MLTDAAFWVGLIEIVWINLLLSGDNAVVIALASRSLPSHLQKWGIVLGTVPAVFLRILFSAVVTYSMSIPLLKLIGGALLIWIAFTLLRQEEAATQDRRNLTCTVWAAAWTIIFADAVMSLDNVVAIAAAAHGNMTLLVIGLVISMPMVICGAGILIPLLTRFPILVIGGSSLLGYIAGDLIGTDPWLIGWIGSPDSMLIVLLPVAIAMVLALAGFLMRRPEPVPVRIPHRDAA